MTQFVDLHLHSTYSNLDAFGSPAQIVERAKNIGRESIALTDHGSVSGLVQLKKACADQGVKPIYGMEAYMVKSIPEMFETKLRTKTHISILASNEQGYKNLLKLASLSYGEGFYYRPTIDKEMLFNHNEGLIVLSGCWSGFVQKCLQDDDVKGAARIIKEFQSVFGDRYYLETQHFPLFQKTIKNLNYLSDKLDIPIVLTCDPHYLYEEQAPIQEILHAIRDRRNFDAEQIIHGAYQWPAEDLLDAVSELFPDTNWPQLFENVVDLSERCNVELPTGGAPRFPLNEDENATETLIQLCKEGIRTRGLEKSTLYKERLQKELKLIHMKDYSDYFLIVADMVNWSKNHGIFVGPARGSSAGSLVCYLTGITEIDPIPHDLVFERFIDESRYDLPDIDIDFEDERRDEVKQYLSEKYGENKVCNVATFAAFKGRNSLDEIGKVFSIPSGEISSVKKFLVDRSGGDMRAELTIQDTFEMSPEASAVKEKYPNLQYAIDLEGNLRHMGQHAAGVIVGDRPLDDIVALYKKDDKNLSSVEMKDASYLGLLKIDVLGITELTVLGNICNQIGWSVFDLYKIPLDDERVFKAFKDLDVSGIFQFEGDSTKSVLRQLPELNFESLVACVTMSKPGPAHSGSTTKYIARARGNKNITGLDSHEILREATKDTHGQIIYQEQVLKIVKELGNLSWTDTNAIRNAMAKSQGEGVVESFWPEFLKGTQEHDLEEKEARFIWDNIQTMGRWAFNKSHAVAYSMLSYWSMYMKVHYPLEFYLARLLKEKDKNKKRYLLTEIRNRNIPIHSPVLGKSKENWTIENKGLRAGLLEVHGVGEKVASALVSDNYQNIDDFAVKKNRGVTKRTVQMLTDAGAFLEDGGDSDFFDLGKYDKLDEIAPDRKKLFDIVDYEKEYSMSAAGSFIEMNYKDTHEEARSRGRSTANLKNPDISKYAMLLMEDETDRCLVHIDRYLFNRIGQKVWDAYHNASFVVIEGIKVDGWRMIRARNMKVYGDDGKVIFSGEKKKERSGRYG